MLRDSTTCVKWLHMTIIWKFSRVYSEVNNEISSNPLAESCVDGVPGEGGVLRRPVPVEPGLRPPQHDVGVHGDAEVDVVDGRHVLHAELDVDPRRPRRHLPGDGASVRFRGHP